MARFRKSRTCVTIFQLQTNLEAIATGWHQGAVHFNERFFMANLWVWEFSLEVD